MACLFGAAFLLLVDDLARTLAATEIPIGILTAFVGAPFFIYLMVKGRRPPVTLTVSHLTFAYPKAPAGAGGCLLHRARR